MGTPRLPCRLPHAWLSDRQFQIIWLIALGWSEARIREHTGMSHMTFRNQVRDAMNVLDIHTRLELALWMIRTSGIYPLTKETHGLGECF